MGHRNDSLSTLIQELREAAAWLIYSFESELGLPFSPSRAITLASSSTILNAVKLSLGKHAGTAEMTTRRLGVDYSLSTKVLSARLHKAKYPAARQNKWAGSTQHSKLFHMGTVPSALFWSECVPASPTQIRSLRADGQKSHRLHSPGIAHDTAWLALAPGKDPAFTAAWAPIARRYREIWHNATTASNMHGDALTQEDMCCIWPKNKAICTKHYGRMPKKPVTALLTGLRTLQWENIKWDTVTLHNAQQVELSICPPAMLKQFSIQAYTQVLTTKFETKLKNSHPDHYDTVHELRHTNIATNGNYLQEQTTERAIQIAFRKASTNTLKARTLLRIISSSILTRAQARKQSHFLEITCPMCGEPESVSHRMHTCFCSAPPEDTHTYPTSISYQRASHMPPPIPKAPEEFILAFCRNGEQVLPFRFKAQDGNIYIDGSVYEGNHVSLARGGCAVVQPAAGKVLQYSMEADLPATAAHVGLVLATNFTDASAEAQANVYADCAGLVSFRERQTQALAYSCPMAGMWRQITEKPAWNHMLIHKTKAHRSCAQAELSDDQQHDLGNDVADSAAKAATAKHRVQDPELTEFLTAAKNTQTNLLRAVDHLLRYNTFFLPLGLSPLQSPPNKTPPFIPTSLRGCLGLSHLRTQHENHPLRPNHTKQKAFVPCYL